MATFLVAHGAWGAGWAWKKMHPLMSGLGHRLITPTYTGLGEREHLSNPDINLDTHIQDILNVIKYEGLKNFILIGHSYGGMVATGVADIAGEIISRLVYLDAFVPLDGQCLFDLVPKENRERSVEITKKIGDGWKLPPNPMPEDTPGEDRLWAEPLRRPQPILTVQQPIRLTRGSLPMPVSYIFCTIGDTPFEKFARRAQEEGWDYHEIHATHNPQITAPQELAALLNHIVLEDQG